jgi:hypothetical protein
MPTSWSARLHDPIWWNDLVQLGKTALAAVGVDPITISTAITSGKVIPGALA